MKYAEEIQEFIDTVQPVGTRKRWYGNLIITGNVFDFINMADAYWLINMIWSYQTEITDWLQVWTLTTNVEENTAVLKGEMEGQDLIITQDIEITNFPLPELKLYVQDDTVHRCVMFPAEY